MHFVEVITVEGDKMLVNLENVTTVEPTAEGTLISFSDGASCVEVLTSFEDIQAGVRAIQKKQKER